MNIIIQYLNIKKYIFFLYNILLQKCEECSDSIQELEKHCSESEITIEKLNEENNKSQKKITEMTLKYQKLRELWNNISQNIYPESP